MATSFYSLTYGAFQDHKDLVGACEIATFKNSSQCLSKISSSELVSSGCFNATEKMRCQDAYGYILERNYSGEFWSVKSEKEWFCDDANLAANIYAAKTAGQVVWMVVLMQVIDM